jgi:hypothetical protein
MKAIRFHAYGGPQVLVLEEIPIPEIHEHVYPLAEVAQSRRDLESRKTSKLVVENKLRRQRVSTEERNDFSPLFS